MYEIVSLPRSSLLLYVSLLKVVLYQHPVGPWCLTIVQGELGNFFIEIMCWAPRISWFQSIGLLSIFLEHSLATSKNLGVSFNMG